MFTQSQILIEVKVLLCVNIKIYFNWSRIDPSIYFSPLNPVLVL